MNEYKYIKQSFSMDIHKFYINFCVCFQCTVPRCCKLYADRQSGVEETGVPISDELC
jgi:hypothetical protein